MQGLCCGPPHPLPRLIAVALAEVHVGWGRHAIQSVRHATWPPAHFAHLCLATTVMEQAAMQHLRQVGLHASPTYPHDSAFACCCCCHREARVRGGTMLQPLCTLPPPSNLVL